MSSGLTNVDWYSDPPNDRLMLSWLKHYVDNVRSNPGLLQALRDDRRFETVPVPRQVLRGLVTKGK